MKRLISALLCGVLMLVLCSPALAAGQVSEEEVAAAYLYERGVMVGDQTGDMLLEKGLTRSELAAILCRLNVNQEHVAAERALYESKCTFPDVPEWARVYVGWCAYNGLMVGYGGNTFGGADMVTSAAACTAVLRHLDYRDTPWDYGTACDTAEELGLIDSGTASEDVITRGELAVLLYRALDGADISSGASEGKGLTWNSDGSINMPSDGSQYIPKAGDVIRCDDGTNYTITDVSRWDNNMFASGSVGSLPEPTCDWSLLPQPDLPAMEVRRYQNEAGDNLRVRNLYETRRMLYTLYNAIGNNPATWENGAPKLNGKGIFPVYINLSFADGLSYRMFWPWRDSEIVDLFNSAPLGTYSMQAWDVYKDGVFLHTEYQIYVI